MVLHKLVFNFNLNMYMGCRMSRWLLIGEGGDRCQQQGRYCETTQQLVH